MSAKDTQVGDDHYKKLGDYQPWEVLKHWLTPEEFRGYMKGTAIAYLARERGKGGDTDIEKAEHTLAGLRELAITPASEIVRRMTEKKAGDAAIRKEAFDTLADFLNLTTTKPIAPLENGQSVNVVTCPKCQGMPELIGGARCCDNCAGVGVVEVQPE